MDDFDDFDNEKLVFSNEYVFLKTNKEHFSELSMKTQNFLSNSHNIHIYQVNHKPFSFDIPFNSNIYVYTFNPKMDEHCINNGYIPHFCFNKDNIHEQNRVNELKDLLLIDSSIEVFWFPGDNDITDKIEPFMDIITQLKLINHPICISFSSIFNRAFDERSHSFVQKIYSAYKNPLLSKERELLECETFSKKNYFIDDTQSDTVQHIILGLHGDQILSELDNPDEIIHQSKKHLQGVKSCLKCEYFQYCSERGIGVILSKNNINNCLGISLFGD